jgi:hypothetical protein
LGQRVGLNAAITTCFRVTDLSVPATLKTPSANSMSCSPASSRWPANFLPLSITLPAASYNAEPPSTVEREPLVPMPKATRSGVAVDILHIGGIHTQPLVQDLLEHGLVALPLVLWCPSAVPPCRWD